MTAASTKAFRDVWQERTRSVFVIATIAVGIAALLALLGTYAILTRELNRGYLATNPASAILHVDGLDHHLLTDVLADPEVEAAEARRTIRGRIKTGPAQWRNLALFVIPNYRDMRLNKFDPEKGEWPPRTGDVLIERDAFQVAHAKIGDTITIRTSGDQTHALRVTGSVHDVGQAQARMENAVYGYITVPTLATIGEDPSLDLLLIKVARDKYNPDHIRQVAAHVKQRLEAEGRHVDDIDFPAPGKHPHADLMAALLLAISSFGFFLLGLSGVLTLNFMVDLMAEQVRQIGVMKAVGATRRQVASIYMVQALGFGVVATLIAVPLGLWGSRLLCSYMAKFLNFDIASYSIPAWVFVSAGVAGLAIPLIACAVPVWRAVAVPARRALASTGTSSESFGVGRIDIILSRVGGGMRPVLLATRNSFRRRTRLALTCMTLACAGVVFMAALNLRTSMAETFDRLFAAERYDLTLDLDQMYPVDKIDRALRAAPGVLASENWIASDGSIPNQENSHFFVVAMPANSKLFVPVMAKGQSLQGAGPDSVILNPTMAARNPQMKVGNEVRLQIGPLNQVWRVAGICREPMLPPAVVYAPYAALATSYPGMANSVKVALKDSERASLELARREIDPALEREGIRVQGGGSKLEFRYAVNEHVLMIYVFLVLASIIVGGVGGLGLTTTMSINVLERRREIGILRAIGATPRMIGAIVIGEAATIAVIAWIIAVLLAYPLGAGLAAGIGNLLHGQFDARVAPLGIAVSLVASAVLAVLASLAAASSAVRITAREALAFE